MDHTACQAVTTFGGYTQVRIGATADTHVHKMPKKPILVPDPHKIYQRVTIELQRLALGGWKSEKTRYRSANTEAGRVNSARSSVTAQYGAGTASGATFRVKITVRVYTDRPGLDRIHWNYTVAGAPFSCPSTWPSGAGVCRCRPAPPCRPATRAMAPAGGAPARGSRR
jgi:hypothetical protein